MTKKLLIVLIAVAVVLSGLGILVPAVTTGTSKVTQALGNTVVVDDLDDLILLRAHPIYHQWHCSLPVLMDPEAVPPWMDIVSAKITQLDRNQVELSMTLHGAVPEAPPIPPFGWLSFFWQFEGGCVAPPPGEPPTRKDNISVIWTVWEEESDPEWRAYWGVITECNPRRAALSDRIYDFSITGAEVRVRVELDDLMLAVDPGEELPWHAGVRRLPFIWTLNEEDLWRTISVDSAPNRVICVGEGDWPGGPPPTVIPGQDPAKFEPR